SSFVSRTPPTPRSTLFPYTTLFRSTREHRIARKVPREEDLRAGDGIGRFDRNARFVGAYLVDEAEWRTVREQCDQLVRVRERHGRRRCPGLGRATEGACNPRRVSRVGTPTGRRACGTRTALCTTLASPESRQKRWRETRCEGA